MGLSPKHYDGGPQYGWDNLDSVLKNTIRKPGDKTGVRISDFTLSREEMTAEAEKQGYTVTYSEFEGGTLFFE